METVGSAAGATVNAQALWEAYSPRIYRYILGLTGDSHTAEDLTQETFLQALRDLGRFTEPPQNEAAWLFHIATNRVRDHFRRQRWRQWLPFARAAEQVSVPDTTETLAEQDLIRQALRRLPPETAVLLLLKDAEGFSAHEIAVMLGQNYEAVRKRIARARWSLRAEYLRLTGGERP